MEAIVPMTHNSWEARESRLISVAPGLTSKANRSEEWETWSFYYHRETPLILVETEHKRFSAMLGDMSILQKSKLSQEATKRRTLKRGILVEERIVSIMPSFLGSMFEFRVKYSCGTISSTLSTHTVVDDMSDVLIMCQTGDVKGLQAAFDNREVSPYVVDQDGSTLLHVRTSDLTKEQIDDHL